MTDIATMSVNFCSGLVFFGPFSVIPEAVSGNSAPVSVINGPVSVKFATDEVTFLPVSVKFATDDVMLLAVSGKRLTAAATPARQSVNSQPE